jgi:hypothetical protein
VPPPSRERCNSFAASRPAVLPGAPIVRSRANSMTRAEAASSAQAAYKSFESTHVFVTVDLEDGAPPRSSQPAAAPIEVALPSTTTGRRERAPSRSTARLTTLCVPYSSESKAIQCLRSLNVTAAPAKLASHGAPRPLLLTLSQKSLPPISTALTETHASAQILCN